MSRARMTALAAVLAVLGAVLLRQAAPGASARPSDAGERVRTTPAGPPATVAPVAAPARDIFSYAGEDDSEPARGPIPDAYRPTALPPPPSLADTAPAVNAGPRLVGILRQGGVLRAAIALDGEVVVVRTGERVGPYTVDAIDEEDGVRLRDGAGTEITLSPER